MLPYISAITCEVPSVIGGIADPVEGSTIDYGSTYSISCNTGYAVGSTGDTSGSCQEDGTFADPTPICDSKLILVFNHQ